MKVEFTEREWRAIHNALATYQSQYKNSEFALKRRKELQDLMNKIRDNFIQTDYI